MKKFLIAFTLIFVAGLTALVAQDPEVTPEPGTGFDIWKILTGVLGVSSMFFAGTVAKVRNKLRQVLKLGTETVEGFDASVALGTTTMDALKDNVVDEIEKKAINASHTKMMKEWSDVRAQWKIVWGVA